MVEALASEVSSRSLNLQLCLMAPNKIKQKTLLLQFFLRAGWGFLCLHGHTEKPFLHLGPREAGSKTETVSRRLPSNANFNQANFGAIIP